MQQELEQQLQNRLAEEAVDITIHYNKSKSKAKKIKKELEEFGLNIHLLKCNLNKEKEVAQIN